MRLTHGGGESDRLFHGWSDADIAGVVHASPHEAKPLGKDAESYSRAVAGAVELAAAKRGRRPLRHGSGTRATGVVVETAEHGGYPLLDHLRKILDAPSSGRRGWTARSC